jgi:glyoxylase-like metal-dependent hydrolase (beta-lactamase superfamily II)
MNTLKFKSLIILIPLMIFLTSCEQNRLSSATNKDGKITTREGITRAEFVAMISDYFAWPHPDNYNDIWKKPIDGFTDISTNDRHRKQIDVALEQGIITKDASGSFNPDTVIIRQDAAAILKAAFLLDVVAAGYMNEGVMSDPLSNQEAKIVFDAITSSVVAPVQAVPVTTAVAPRRYIKLWCPTEGATIYFTRDGSEPTMESEVYNIDQMGHIQEMVGSRGGTGATQNTREVVYKAFAVKDGKKSSVKTMVWNLYRPLDHEFQSDLLIKGDATTPRVYRVFNDSESVRAMCWFIEGPQKGIVFDALQTTVDRHNLKDYIDKLATKPYVLIVGHEHGDHDAQMPAFLDAGVEVYLNERGWSSVGGRGGFGGVVPDTEKQKLVKNVDEGDSFDLGGGFVFEVYAMPGHANGNIVINDKKSGMVFGSDIYGCTRAGSGDNVSVSGLKADLLLSFTQQAYSNYTKGDAVVKMLFTGHDELMLSNNNLLLFEQALQQVIDKGEDGCTPSLRGGSSRVTTVGDMWKDGTNWISLVIGGNLGDGYEYLTNNATANYNAGGHTKYSVLSNIEIEGGDLVGTTVAWSNPRTFEWGGEQITVPSSLPDKFDPWTFNYTIKVPAANKKITIIPTTMSTKVTEVRLNGNLVRYRSRNEVEVTNGQVIEITVVAPDGTTTSKYSFTIEVV